MNIVLRSGKKAIGAGAGNPPALVDETATIRKAAQCIVSGASINNGIFCTCEKEVIVVEEVADDADQEHAGDGPRLSPQSRPRWRGSPTWWSRPERKINGDYIGKNVQVILHDAGSRGWGRISAGDLRRPKDHPLVWLEQMMPVLPIVRVKDFNAGS